MRNRDLVIKKLERLEGISTNLKRIVKTNQPISEYIKMIEEQEQLIEELKSLIELENISSEEIKYPR